MDARAGVTVGVASYLDKDLDSDWQVSRHVDHGQPLNFGHYGRVVQVLGCADVRRCRAVACQDSRLEAVATLQDEVMRPLAL